MNPFTVFRNLETKYALTFMGFVIGVVGIALTLYTLVQKTGPSLRMELVSSANVVDVKEDIGKLDVLYEGINLRSNRQTLAVSSVRISNDGTAPIHIGDYDPRAPIGIELRGGQVVKAEVFQPSNKYLEDNLTNIHFSTSTVLLPPVILEPADAFWVKLLVLHEEKGDLDFRPRGKIAGIRNIGLLALNAKQAPPSFWKIVFNGNFNVQVGRALAYAVGYFILFVILIRWDALQLERQQRKVRRKLVEKYRKTNSVEIDTEHEWLFDFFIEEGEWVIRLAMQAIERPRFGESSMEQFAVRFAPSPRTARKLFERLNNFEKDKDFEATVRKFFDYLQLRKPKFYGGGDIEGGQVMFP